MFSAFEVDPASLVARFTEGLRLMKALGRSRGSPSRGASGNWTAQRWSPSRSKPHPPIWSVPTTPPLRRAVRYGDGFFGAGSTTTSRFAEQVRIVREALAEAGQDRKLPDRQAHLHRRGRQRRARPTTCRRLVG